MTPYTRRDFTKLALAALPAAGALSALPALRAEEGKAAPGRPNSKVNGVHIGINVPYSFGSNAISGDETLQGCVQLGLSAVELRLQPVEAFLGLQLPVSVVARGDGAGAQANAAALEKFRRSVAIERVGGFRKKYEDAGVMIEVLKVDGIFQMPDDILDYSFAVAKGVGARAISTEISSKDDDLKRIGRFADKHQLMVGYHGHASTTQALWEKAFSFAKYNGANVDLGHFVAGNNTSLVELILKHHERITHVHVKDRRINGGDNVPFGEGDTPIVEVLRIIRDHRWPIQATIEFEYKIPAGSNRMTEIARAIKYCRNALA